MNTNMNISRVTWQKSQPELSMIRTVVFIQEQGVSAEEEMDNMDESAEHFLVHSTSGEAIACARVLIEMEAEKNMFHIGRVAVLKHYRNIGIGHQLMQTIVHWCLQHGTSHGIYLNAQTERIGFYQRLNFVTQGDIFMDAGIPHIKMWHKAAKV
jgi:predicted GNAT family N-acyltransferase